MHTLDTDNGRHTCWSQGCNYRKVIDSNNPRGLLNLLSCTRSRISESLVVKTGSGSSLQYNLMKSATSYAEKSSKSANSKGRSGRGYIPSGCGFNGEISCYSQLWNACFCMAQYCRPIVYILYSLFCLRKIMSIIKAHCKHSPKHYKVHLGTT